MHRAFGPMTNTKSEYCSLLCGIYIFEEIVINTTEVISPFSKVEKIDSPILFGDSPTLGAVYGP